MMPPAESSAVRGNSLRRVQRLAAAALFLFYLAVMNGHMSSMDGVLVQHQAHTMLFDYSIRFRSPTWYWTGVAGWNSKFGIGLSLAYLPGLAVAAPLARAAPISTERPAQVEAFYWAELYENPFYQVGASWVHAVIAALVAYCVARLASALGASRRASLWGMAFCGIGSLMLAYARGDFSQPLVALCWTAALLAAVRVRATGARAAIWACAFAAGYAILARPFEGLMLVPAALLLVLPADRSRWSLRELEPAIVVCSGAAAALVLTALVNWARWSDPVTSGYHLEGVWTMPDATRLAHLAVGPARGILWQFPAIVLVPAGVMALLRSERRHEAVALLLPCMALFTVVALWRVWWGGWCWGLRLFLPAIPLLAVFAAIAVDQLRSGTRRALPPLLLAAGFLWSLPCVVTDVLGGYAQMTDAAPRAWTLAAFPPYGAWSFVRRIFAEYPSDIYAVDILWFRLANATSNWSLAIPVILLAAAAALLLLCRREVEDAQPEADTRMVPTAD